ncbi:hypothetical protein RFI_31096, partial [Reticulomyxa filosa]
MIDNTLKSITRNFKRIVIIIMFTIFFLVLLCFFREKQNNNTIKERKPKQKVKKVGEERTFFEPLSYVFSLKKIATILYKFKNTFLFSKNYRCIEKNYNNKFYIIYTIFFLERLHFLFSSIFVNFFSPATSKSFDSFLVQRRTFFMYFPLSKNLKYFIVPQHKQPNLSNFENLLWSGQLLQCLLHKHELFICGRHKQRACYFCHTLKNEYKFICEYPIDVELFEQCVVKLVDNNNQITLLSFGGYPKHTLVMKYVSVWSNGSNNDDENENEIKLTNQIIIMNISLLQAITIVQLSLEKNDGYYNGARAAIGGVNNHLLFITYPTKNNNTFQFHQLHACNNIKSLSEYAYVRINDVMLFLVDGISII